MSRLATNPTTSSKQTRKDDGTNGNGFAVAGGSATPTELSGTTNIIVRSILPLNAALVTMKKGTALLPNVSNLFLFPQCDSLLRKGAHYFHAHA